MLLKNCADAVIIMMESVKVVAVCAAKIGDRACFEAVKAINDAMTEAGYHVFVYHTSSDFYWNTPNEEGEKAVFELIDYQYIDAVVILAGSFKNQEPVREIIEKAKEHRKPVICIDGYCQGAISVLPDYSTCFEKIVRHIIEYHGVRDVGFLAGMKENEYAKERLAIYRKVLKENGVDYDEDRVAYGDFWSEPARAAVEEMILKNKVPKALICANDVMAIAACAKLKEYGYRVPEDVLVTGFDGIMEGQCFQPNLTSCKNNYREMGNCVAALLKKLFQGEQPDEINRIDFEANFSQSCGCGKGHSVYGGDEMIRLNDRFNYYRTWNRNLHEASAEILNCDRKEQIPEVLHKYMPDHVICLVNRSFFEMTESVNERGKAFDEEMCILYDSREGIDNKKELKTHHVSKNGELPGLTELIKKPVPVVFTAVCFCNHAIGYVGTYFDMKQNLYSSIAQCAIGISNALGGFRNVKYQEYLFGKLERTYTHDALTGLLNRHGFYKYSEQLLNEMADKKDACVVMMSADLDGLKYINDQYGHLEGDQAIIVAAEAIMKAGPQEKICFRFGGDEILCLIPVYDEYNPEQEIRKEVRGFLDEYNRTSGKAYEVSMSIGFSRERIDEFSLEKIIKKADMRMYSEKRNKKEINSVS